MIHTLGTSNSIFNQFIGEIRDEKIQKDSMRFRRNMERMGEIMAYEISKNLAYKPSDITTSLGVAKVSQLVEQPVVASVLRAGLPVHIGVLNYFDRAENAFISAYRHHHKDGSFDIKVEYLACPDLNNKILILCDPMLATGQSMALTYKALLQRGQPRHTHVVSIIASMAGVDYVKKHLPENVTIWCGAIDEELTSQSYIVPGIGDAGDLSFGEKI